MCQFDEKKGDVIYGRPLTYLQAKGQKNSEIEFHEVFFA